MINILLAFDEEDENIGPFNQGCKEDYEAFFNGSKYKSITYINSKTLNSLNIQLRTETQPSFIFAAYSHGENHRLFSKAGDYVSSTVNVSRFKNSFFYTVSCFSGNELGAELVKNGCKCYFGYKTLFNSWLGYKDFSDCANYGFFKFIEGVRTDEIFVQMISKYNTHVDSLYKENFFQASLLRENRDGLIKVGENITVDNLKQTG